MSLRKFISGVTAFAVAASAFAAMAVTASAKQRTASVTITSNNVYGFSKDNKDGTYKTNDNSASGADNYSRIVVDLRSLPDIDNAILITVEFNTKVPLFSSGIPKLVYGVGDADTRGVLAGDSNATDGYNHTGNGLMMCFGSLSGKKYQIKANGVSNGLVDDNSLGNKVVSASITLNRETKRYSITLTPESGAAFTRPDVPAQGIDNLTLIEAFAWGDPAYNLTFGNITVSYTTSTEAFTFTEPLNSLQDLQMHVTKGDGETAEPIKISKLLAQNEDKLDGVTVFTGTGDVKLAIIFENIPADWGDLSVVLK